MLKLYVQLCIKLDKKCYAYFLLYHKNALKASFSNKNWYVLNFNFINLNNSKYCFMIIYIAGKKCRVFPTETLKAHWKSNTVRIAEYLNFWFFLNAKTNRLVSLLMELETWIYKNYTVCADHCIYGSS